MATDLEELIQYWKDRLTLTSEYSSGQHIEAIQATIAYLERLNELWKEQQKDEPVAIKK